MSDEAQEFWDEVHRGRDRSCHHAPHPYVRKALASAVPGRALELGCGNGNTAVWLASQGWTVTAVDISRVALDAAAEHAEHAGVSSRITWQHADLRDWTTQQTFDLVTAFFLHTPLELDDPALLARAAAQTRARGTLLSVGHYTLPPWAWNPGETDGLRSASEIAAALGVHEPEWQTILAQELPRTVTGHDGHASTVHDAVLHAVRATPNASARRTCASDSAPTALRPARRNAKAPSSARPELTRQTANASVASSATPSVSAPASAMVA